MYILDLDEGGNVVEGFINGVKLAQREASLPRPYIYNTVVGDRRYGFFIPWKEVKAEFDIYDKLELKIIYKRTREFVLSKNTQPRNSSNSACSILPMV